MKKVLLGLMVAMMVTGVAAQGEETPEDLDVGLFAADHPLHNLELVVDNIGMSVGLVDVESVAEKRANEAADLAERDVEGIETALDRVEEINGQLAEVDNGTEAVASITDRMNQVVDSQPDFENRTSEVVDSLPDRSGENISADFTAEGDQDEVTVSGNVEVPTTGYSIEDTSFSNGENGIEFVVDLVESNQPFTGQAFMSHDFSGTLNVDEGNYTVDMIVELDNENVVEDSADVEVG